MKTKLKKIVEDVNNTGRYFNFFIQALILLSLISFSISTLPGLSPWTRSLLAYFEIFSVTIFTIEYILRIYVADSKRKYIFSPMGLIDLFAILPFYLTTAVDLRSLRVFRLFRLLRLLKMFRYKDTMKRYREAFSKIKAELYIFLGATAFMLYISSVGIYYFEHNAQPEVFKSIFHSMWWAVATLTTVGYGDAYPITLGGKMFTFLVLMIGLSVVALPAGLFASALEETPQKGEHHIP